MNGQRIGQINLWLTAALFLLACALPFYTAPAPAPQAPPNLGTIIAQTAAAAQTQTAVLMPSPTNTPPQTRTPTFTSIPPTATQTFFFALPTWTLMPTFTLFPTSTNSGGGGGGGNGGRNTPDPNEWVCVIKRKSPADGVTVKPGAFVALWTIKNIGAKTWSRDGVDFMYKSGYRNAGPQQDLSKTVAPGEKVTIKITVTAPKKTGTYQTVWMLRSGKIEFCRMDINFKVK